MHISFGLPLTSAEQEPHLPALQFHRTARSGVCVCCRRWMISSTTSPSLTSTVKSCSSPPASSRCRSFASPSWVLDQLIVGEVLLQLGNLEDLQQIGAHRHLVFTSDL